jgi:hypothetical protein
LSNSIRDMVMSRWKPSFDDVPRLKSVRAALDAALNAQDAVRDRHATLAKNQHLSPIGRLDDVRSFVAKSTAPAIHGARAAAKSMRDDLIKQKASLQPAAPDPSNVSAAVLRSEMRTMLRGLSTSARTALLVSQNPDPTLVQAVLEAPSFSSGISDDVRARLLEFIVNRDHPKELEAIAQAEEAVEVLEAATGMTYLAAKLVSDFPSEKVLNDFIDANAPAMRSAADLGDSDLLKQLGDVVRSRVPDNRTERDFLAEARAELAAL